MKLCNRCNGYGILLNPTLADKKEFPLTQVYEKCKDCNGRGLATGMKVEDILKSINENYKNEDVIQVKNIFIFENGNVAVCDNNGKQIPFLQGILSNSNIVIKQPQL